MPDGDLVHAHLTGAYQKPYKQMCEGQFSDVENARSVLSALRRDIQHFGDEPIKLMLKVAAHLQLFQDAPLLRASMDWGTESRQIDVLAQQAWCSKAAVELAVKACKEHLLDIRSGFSSNDVAESIISTYMRRMYGAYFEERVPLPRHYRDASPAFIQERLELMRPFIEQGIIHFAGQVVRNGTVTRLRLERRPRSRSDFDLYGALPALG